MILHVTFSDSSNPWVSLAHDRKTIAKQWRKWMKYHPETAQPQVTYNGYICEYSVNKKWIWVYKPGRVQDGKTYKHIGHALRALERLGGGQK